MLWAIFCTHGLPIDNLQVREQGPDARVACVQDTIERRAGNTWGSGTRCEASNASCKLLEPLDLGGGYFALDTL